MTGFMGHWHHSGVVIGGQGRYFMVLKTAVIRQLNSITSYMYAS